MSDDPGPVKPETPKEALQGSVSKATPPKTPPKPTHVIYLMLIVVGICLLTISILDRFVIHYANTQTYGLVAPWLLILTSLTTMAGGLHIWRIYRQFYAFEEDVGDSDFADWINTPPELVIRYGLFITLICALSKADGVFELAESLPRIAQFLHMEPTVISKSVSAFAREHLASGQRPGNYTIGCAIMFALLVLWSFIAFFKVKTTKRFTVSIWIGTDVVATIFWMLCAIAVLAKPNPQDMNGNAAVGFFACIFGLLYTAIILGRLFLGTSWGTKFAQFLAADHPESLTRFAL